MTGSTRRLSEVARHLVFPSSLERSVYPHVEERLGSVGVRFDEWQRGLGMVALGLNKDGKFASTVGGVVASIPRQVGKTFTVGHLAIGLCMTFPGLRVIWTSHHLSTTDNTFMSMQGMVRGPRMAKHIRDIRLANGQQRITFANGSVIMFGARSMGFGRGMDKIDVMVFDEAQILGTKALEDMVPATNQAQNPHGGLLFFIGTPPRPQDDGDAFELKRRQALEGKSDHMVYVEFSADEDASTDDEKQWPIMNPSYPHRTPYEAMLRMRENLPDDHAWRREAMGIWDRPDEVEQMLPEWPNLVGVGPEPGAAPDVYAIDRSATGGVTIVAGWSLPDSRVHVEEVFASWDLESAADWLTEASKPRDQILVDAMSSGTALIPLLRARRRRPVKTTTADMIAACALLEEAVKAGTLSHDGGESMMVAVAGAKKRDVRSQTGGGWAWDRRDKETPIHALVAASLAVFGVSRKPERSSGRVVTVS